MAVQEFPDSDRIFLSHIEKTSADEDAATKWRSELDSAIQKQKQEAANELKQETKALSTPLKANKRGRQVSESEDSEESEPESKSKRRHGRGRRNQDSRDCYLGKLLCKLSNALTRTMRSLAGHQLGGKDA